MEALTAVLESGNGFTGVHSTVLLLNVLNFLNETP